MTIDGDQAAVIALGATLAFGLGAGFFRLADLRARLNDRWSSRVDLAVVSLDEKTLLGLRGLRDQVDATLPAGDAPFDPVEAIVDPSPLESGVKTLAEYYRARVSMRNLLARILWLARVVVVMLAALAVGVLLLTLHYGDLLEGSLVQWSGLVVGGVAVTALVGAGVTYNVSIDRLTTIEMLAGTAGRSPGADG